MIHRLLLLLGLVLSCVSCSLRDLDEPALERFHVKLLESSGIARSIDRPDLWFTHNDSGGAPELFSFDLTSDNVAFYPVMGAEAVDWEDLASGPCPGGNGACLYIADIGDNLERRERVQIYAVAEPQEPGPVAVLATWSIKYPEGPRDAETLLVHPQSGAMTIVTKSMAGRSQVLRIPPMPGEVDAILIDNIQFSGDNKWDRTITAGDWSPDGSRVVVRSYLAAYEWTVDKARPDAHWPLTPTHIPLPRERQGEAIAYLPDGRLFTSSEGQPMALQITDAPE